MRTIEKNMIQAVNEGRDFFQGNTTVEINEYGIFVRLYSTIIFAQVRGRRFYSDGGYNTVTTSSRLRALGADYSTNDKKNRCKLRNNRQMINLYYCGKLNA